MDTLPLDTPTLGARGTWAGVRGTVTNGFVLSETPGWSRYCGGGTAAGSAVNAEMSANEDGLYVGGSFPSSEVMVWGWETWVYSKSISS